MYSKHRLYLIIICLLNIALASFIWLSNAMAAEYLEEFNDKILNKKLWEVKAEGKASYEIKDGQLTMTSPGVDDGILIYWRGSDVSDENFSIEIKAKVEPNTNNAAIIAFIRKDLPPTLNTTINAEWKNMFWCGSNTPGWYINNDDWKNSGVKGPEFEGVWKADIKGANIDCYFNKDLVVTVDKIPERRFLCFGPDTYTSHYSGAMTVDWIKLTGPSVPATAVEPLEKLSTAWGNVKRGF